MSRIIPFFTICIIKLKLYLLQKVLKAKSTDGLKQTQIFVSRSIKLMLQCFRCNLYLRKSLKWHIFRSWHNMSEEAINFLFSCIFLPLLLTTVKTQMYTK